MRIQVQISGFSNSSNLSVTMFYFVIEALILLVVNCKPEVWSVHFK